MWYFIVFIVVLVVGIITKFYYHPLWEWFGLLDTASAVALALLAGWGYFEYIKNEQEIKIFFVVNKTKIDTHLSILRKNFSRSELLGLLGMIQKEQVKRFEIEKLKNPEILKDIHKIQKGKEKFFYLSLTEDEFKQFSIKEETE